MGRFREKTLWVLLAAVNKTETLAEPRSEEIAFTSTCLAQSSVSCRSFFGFRGNRSGGVQMKQNVENPAVFSAKTFSELAKQNSGGDVFGSPGGLIFCRGLTQI